MEILTHHLEPANAVQIAHLLGLGSERRGKEGLFESELRRRLFWACFLVNCHGADSPFAIFSTKAVEHLSLPWHEDDFEACRLSQPLVSLSSGTTNGGIWCELVKAMSIWYLYRLESRNRWTELISSPGQQYMI